MGADEKLACVPGGGVIHGRRAGKSGYFAQWTGRRGCMEGQAPSPGRWMSPAAGFWYDGFVHSGAGVGLCVDLSSSPPGP